MRPRSVAWREIDAMRHRPARPAIRELPLRCQRGKGPELAAWRGRSGKSYVVVVHPFGALSTLFGPEDIALAVRRGADGKRAIVAVDALDLLRPRVAELRRDGATELHVHRLADTPAARVAMVRDLDDVDVPAMPNRRLPPMPQQPPPAVAIVRVV